ncbi:MAG: ABC transporter permease [Acidobacteria bacterium]|nr:ABC transporter permease [Acidobacteriota bacterium]MBI3663664.1 ABC transporter permease [Acidobacteriota bacterium]
MKHAGTLAKIRMRLALRSKAFLFFSVILPLGFLFFYAGVFGHGDPRKVAYVLAQVLSLTVMGSFWGLSAQLVIFREQGILRRFRLAPVGAAAMLASSVMSNYVLVLPTVVMEFLIAHWVFGMTQWGNLLGAFVIVSLGGITFSALGLIVASVTNNMQETQVINNAVWFCFLFMSGAAIPLPILPSFIQRVALFLPATYLVTGLQSVLVRHASLLNVTADVIALAGSFAVAFVISWQLFRWEPEERLPGRAKLWAAAAMIPFLLLGAWESTRGDRRAEANTIFESLQPLANPSQTK